METRSRIWVAVDAVGQEACDLIRLLRANCIYKAKLGLEALTDYRREMMLECARQEGVQVFWDGKFNDIPNTVGRASMVVSAREEVVMFNVMANCGHASIKAAVANKGTCKVLAVTLLTSLAQDDLPGIGYDMDVNKDDVVGLMALTAISAGVDGIICSVQEVPVVRDCTKGHPDMMIVTPGIRPAWAATNDQKRVATPAEAIKAGATHLVIGRPITNPPPEVGTPAEAIRRIVEEMDQAIQEMGDLSIE